MSTFGEFREKYLEWVAKTFPSESVKDQARHLVKEANELLESLEAEEVADCFMLLLCIANRLDLNVVTEAEKKFAIIQDREWVRGADGIMEHKR